jgi:hypothetical protein
MPYNISKAELESEVHQRVQDVLDEKINWNTAFGLTQRRNGEVVDGNPRDTIDTRNLYDNIEVEVDPNRIRINFNAEDAEWVFHWRDEMGEIMVDGVVDDFVVDIAQYVIQSVLRG